ncbi:bifunctional DNA primase/polymerase [Acetobacter suratthaniensis]|uniref:Bifunctional DNA primase/polymerase n=1 Tax=Acetobacter suratthaniensis TaxID=1502841 RepID=A0ABS3LH42_9PROT|nr:bifunctional DNA primase/polymerase [Acetobacter suratthaniensis]MBO1326909.1 bifunctional DNA primase/polymerase [Acetobacter suratthaniensis]MCX2565484.1 bifunctional DNA primase/polymerase [Acetobacter suratthaniensis]
MSAALDQSDRPVSGDPVAAYAQKLARHGLKVFPCQQDKRPTCKWGELATNRPQSVPMLWRTYPGPLIGVMTGAVSGFDVLDLDWGKGGDDFHQEHCPRLTGTRTHRTRSGGLHLLFKHREGMRNSASRIAHGVDVRADGGYVIWWPAAGLEIVDRSPAQQWPAWLVERAQPPIPPKASLEATSLDLQDAEKKVRNAVRSAVRSVASAPEGRRNDTLNAETYAIARFIAGGHLTVAQVVDAVAAGGLQAGLTHPEIEKTIASALRARVGV